jgi:predicted dehydrogenase/threonine dehydrogenase-like Zn-dependent dehydrogenase
MKQVTQRLRDGAIQVIDAPEPILTPETVLVEVHASLLSVGTERSKVEAGRKSLLGKARSRPDQVAQVVEKARSDGVRQTVQAVRTRLDQPSALGYSAAGVVLGVGSRVTGVSAGDRVAIGGGGYAVHAEVDCVPGNLCVPLPDTVAFEEGAFATVGAIAMHGVRQARVTLGERVAVIGLGLVGQLAGLLLRAAGCEVVGIDLNESVLRFAQEAGAVDTGFLSSDLQRTRLPARASECDAVLLAAATLSSDPIALSAELCRDRGRVVVVGDVGLGIPRAPFYDKEIDLRLSRSYGPGRYDPQYEEHGVDYPVGYVRWTERRNMAAFVELVASGRAPIAGLITERIPVDDAPSAYERLVKEASSPLGVIISYRDEGDRQTQPAPVRIQRQAPPSGAGAVSVIGAGSFSQRIMIPGLIASGFAPIAVSSARGLSAKAAMERFSFNRVATPDQVIGEDDAGLVAIATRHASHAELAARVLRTGRSVFVEKPPCLTWEELEDLRSARSEGGGMLFVGFNRRHAPQVSKMKEHLNGPGHPTEILIRVAVGHLQDDSWILDPDDGGGRLLGEGCHFVDLACWIVAALPTQVTCTSRPPSQKPASAAQRFSISLDFEDGSLATILYTAEGAPGLSKEYIETHSGGRTAILDDFRRLTTWDGRRSKRTGRRQKKGHQEQFQVVKERLADDARTEDLDPLSTMAATLAALDAARLGVARPPSPPSP